MCRVTNLTDALAEFDRQLRRLTPLAFSHKIPGLSRDEIGMRFDEAGLRVPDDLVQWFSWQNGSDAERPRLSVGPGYWCMDLDSLAGMYAERTNFIAANLPQEVEYEIGWFPIMETTSGGTIVADCRGPQDHPVQCTLLSPERLMKNRLLYTLSLTETLELWATAMMDGTWEAVDGDPWPDWTSNRPDDSLPLQVSLTGLAL